MSDLKDPRVFFAAERTLLAWTRTSLALMAFGFVVERASVFLQMVFPERAAEFQNPVAFWIGVSFIFLGGYAAVVSTAQFMRVRRTLSPVEIPPGYRIYPGILINAAVALLALVLAVYLSLHGAVAQ